MNKKKPTGQEFILLPQYLDSLLNWKLWIDKAAVLHAGAQELESHLRSFWDIINRDFKEGRYAEGGEPPHKLPRTLDGVYFILIAYAVENLFKAVIIYDQQDTLRSSVLNKLGQFPRKIKTHDLIYLAKEAHFNFNVPDEDLLIRLYRNSDWAGRYPVPISSSKLNNIKVFTTDGLPHLTALFRPSDIDYLNTLLQRVRNHVKDSIKSTELPEYITNPSE